MGAAASISGVNDPRVAQIRAVLQDPNDADNDRVLLSKLKHVLQASAERGDVPDQTGSAPAVGAEETAAQEPAAASGSNGTVFAQAGWAPSVRRPHRTSSACRSARSLILRCAGVSEVGSPTSILTLIFLPASSDRPRCKFCT